MAETIGPHRVKRPLQFVGPDAEEKPVLSRYEPDAEGKPVRKAYKAGDVFTPTEAELKAFGDRLEPVTGTPAPTPHEEPLPDEPHAGR